MLAAITTCLNQLLHYRFRFEYMFIIGTCGERTLFCVISRVCGRAVESIPKAFETNSDSSYFMFLLRLCYM